MTNDGRVCGENGATAGSARPGRQQPRLPRPGGAPIGRALMGRAVIALVTLITVALLMLGTALAAPAQAAGSFVFAGRGNGHGVGMSQWGAWQGAREGNSYQQILAFYYPGTTLGTADPGSILKVRISSKPWTSNTTVFSQVDLQPAASPATLRLYSSIYSSNSEYSTIEVPVGTKVAVDNDGRKVRVILNGEERGLFQMVEIVPDEHPSPGRVEIGLTTAAGTAIEPREYWGTIRVQPGEGAADLWVYNFVPLEKYVRGIAEIDYDWATPGGAYYAPEAVKAQAVASRSYAVAKKGATLSDNWADQCYRGYSFEAKYPGVAQAAEATAGQILTWEGQAIVANFSGHSGGYTTNSAWSGPKPLYLVCQPDPWSLGAPPAGVGKGPGWEWIYTISAEALSLKVNGSLRDVNSDLVDIGTISAVEVAARDTDDAASHATRLRLTGSGGTAIVSVSSFRSLVGTSNLPSTLILTINGDPGVGEPGGGPGNGGGDGGTGGDGGGGGGGDGETGGPLMAGEFYDVGPAHLYHDQIARVVIAQLMDGYANGLFKPEGSVSRAQFAKIAVSLHNLMNQANPIVVTNVTSRPFADVPVDSRKTGDSSDWIAAAKKAGLVTGLSASTFSPASVIKRDQMATMMCRALGWQDEAERLSRDVLGFSDVLAGSTHWAAATYLRQQGILLGYAGSDGSSALLGAGEPIKRQHVAVILCRVLDLQK